MTLLTPEYPRAREKNEWNVIEQTLNLSADWYNSYIQRHAYPHRGFTANVIAQLAMARYEWLLATVREKILRTFSNDELYIVALTLNRELAIPNDYPLAHAIAEDNWILWKNYQQSKYYELIEKVLALTPLEDMALRDIVEGLWHSFHEVNEWFPEYIARERNR